ncbi:MAG: hypothetical protein ACLPZM_08470 [Thermoplasmata archaeon]
MPELTLPTDLALPFRQELRIPSGDWASLGPVVATTLEAATYRLVRSRERLREKDPSGSAPPSAPVIVAERDRHPIRMLRPMQACIWALFAAGLILGGFDTVAVGNLYVLLPWVFVAAGIAGLFWYRWGRSYESDVLVVQWEGGKTVGPIPPSTPVPQLVWWSGRVRSDIRGRARTAVSVEYITPLASELGDLVRAFTARLAASGPRGPVP